jgi:ATP-dependent protease ClpP protease subunit
VGIYRLRAVLDADPATEPSGGATGQASDIAIHAKEILRVRQVLTNIYQHHCAGEAESHADGIARFGMWIYFLSEG